MVFVHARNETVRTALTLIEIAKQKGEIALFAAEQSRSFGDSEKLVKTICVLSLKEML